MERKTFCKLIADVIDFIVVSEKLGIRSESIKNDLLNNGTLIRPFAEIEDRIVSEEFKRLEQKYINETE